LLFAGYDSLTLLSIAGLSKAYGGVPALRGAKLELSSGEVHALMGENGAGKSTLIKILAGAVAPDAGDIRIEGMPVTITSPAHAHALGLRFIHQELNVVPQMSVAENLFLGHGTPRRLGAFVDWRRLHDDAASALSALGIDGIDPRRTMARLSTGDRMLVRIASAFHEGNVSSAVRPGRIYVMDEPTAALNGHECERLFSIIRTLRQKGCGILFVSHRMDEVMQICDRVTVLRDGETRASLPVAQTGRAEIIRLMTGRPVNEDVRSASSATQRTALVLSCVTGKGFSDVSLEVREGEILGLAGLEGSGHSELLSALMNGAFSGEARLVGEPFGPRQPADAWKRGVAAVPGERRAEGLILSQAIAENATLPHLGSLRRLGLFLDRERERRNVSAVATRVKLKSAGLDQRLWQLSGGNQQKVVFARAVLGSPRLLLLVEPTRGVDVGAKYDIHALLREIAATGAATLVASSDFPELASLCDRIAIFRNGSLGAMVDAAGTNAHDILALCYDQGEGAAA
jgi:ABC-type sugar transport system ATPase subunit